MMEVEAQGNYIFQLGDTFSSYQELEEQLEEHRKESCVTYWHRDTRTLKAGRGDRPISKKLVYYSLRLACVFGGQKFSPRGQGIRTCQTLRSDCPAHIALRASKCGKKLVVISVCNTHNHELSEKLNKSLPQNRELSPEMKEEVLRLLNSSEERYLIIEYIKLKTGKELTRKDLTNMAAAARRKKENLVVNEELTVEAVKKMKNYLLKHSDMFVDEEPPLIEIIESKSKSKNRMKQEKEEDNDKTLKTGSITLKGGNLIEVEVVEGDSKSVQVYKINNDAEDDDDSQIIEYLPEEWNVGNEEIPKEQEDVVMPMRRRKRWKTSCCCHCQSSSIKLMQLRMKFLRLKYKKLLLEVDELKRRKKELSRRSRRH
uniref:ZSWIM3 N-terminal domain-containing protein n=1 Tax=Lutzomyia longipalpis TaxID=7200 RepID=A0A1B0CFC2_LUTLO